MKLRLAAPEVIIDLGALHELSYVDDTGSYVAIGALTRHHDVEHSEVLAREVPLLAHAAGQVGDPQIRHRGTIGGSIAHDHPGPDPAAGLLTPDATLLARRPGLGPARRAAPAGRDHRRARPWRFPGDPDRGVLPGPVRDRPGARRT